MYLPSYENKIVTRFKKNPREYIKIQKDLDKHLLQLGFYPVTSLKQPFPMNLLPLFVSSKKALKVFDGLKHIIAALIKVRNEFYENPELQKYLSLPEKEREILYVDNWVKGISNIRADGFIDDSGQVKFVELNTDYPDGLATIPHMLKYYLSLPHMKQMSGVIEKSADLNKLVVDSMLYFYKLNGGQGSPMVGLFAPTDRWWQGEFEQFSNLMKSKKLGGEILDPLKMKFKRSGLVSNGQKINMLRKCTEMQYFINHFAELKAFFKNYSQKKFVLYNSFQDRFLGYKSMFAVLTDPHWSKLFNGNEKRAIKKHIPWTSRIFLNGKIIVSGKEVNAIDYLEKNRKQCVIKPAGITEGHGVFIGSMMSGRVWIEKVGNIIDRVKKGEDWIVQEKAPIGYRKILKYQNGKFDEQKVVYDIVFYLFGMGDALRNGILLSRSSINEVVNLAQGGALHPVFLIKGK